MSDPFYSEVRIFAFNYAPYGWATCDGTIINVQQNPALYSLVQNAYGGTPGTSFALPNLKGRVPLGAGQGAGLTFHPVGAVSGSSSVALSDMSVPTHTHIFESVVGKGAANLKNDPGPTVTLAQTSNQSDYGVPTFVPNAPSGYLNSRTVNPTLGNAQGFADPHENRQPYLVMNFCICVDGIYPPRP